MASLHFIASVFGVALVLKRIGFNIKKCVTQIVMKNNSPEEIEIVLSFRDKASDSFKKVASFSSRGCVNFYTNTRTQVYDL